MDAHFTAQKSISSPPDGDYMRAHGFLACVARWLTIFARAWAFGRYWNTHRWKYAICVWRVHLLEHCGQKETVTLGSVSFNRTNRTK